MIIDVHGHLVPPDLLAAIRKESGRFPSLRLIEDGASLAIAFAGGKPSRPIMKGLSDVVGRLAWMDKQGSTVTSSEVGPTGSAMSCRRRKARPGAASSTTPSS